MPIVIYHEEFDSKKISKVILHITKQISIIIPKKLQEFWGSFLEIDYPCLKGYIEPKWLNSAKKVNFDLCMFLRNKIEV